MALITYADKDNVSAEGSAERTWRHEDANEVKDVVNANILINLKWVGNVAIGGGTLSVLTGATGSGSGGAIKKADVFYNTSASTALLSPDGVSYIPAGTWIIALQDTPASIGHFSFITSLI